MPSISELGQMEFMGFPAYKEAQNQVGLANLLQQQKLQQGQGEIDAQSLKNLFDSQNNPQRLEQQRLSNEGSVFENNIRGVKSRNDTAMEADDLEARRQKAFSVASEEKLKQLEAQGQAEMMHPDPTIAERGRKKMEASWEELKRRNKSADDLKKTETLANSRERIADNREDGLNDRNARDNETRRAAAMARENAVRAKAEGSPKNAEQAALRAQMKADDTEDPEEKAFYLDQAKGYTAYSMALKNAAAGNKPDMSEFVKTVQVNTGMGTNRTRPAGATQDSSRPGQPPSYAYGSKEAANAGAIDVIERELAKPGNSEADTAGMRRELARLRGQGAAPAQTTAPASQAPAKAPAAPAGATMTSDGRIYVYKDGKRASVLASQVDAAKKQGYSVTK